MKEHMNRLEAPENWQKLDSLLWRHSFDTQSKKYRPYIAFRGLPKDYGDLRTGLQRLGDPGPQPDAIELRKRERRLIDSFRMYASEHLSLGSSDWDVLLLAQHYRLPTRLLDWTSSPYAALFFATEDSSKDQEDGIIWCVSRLETNTSLPLPFKEILQCQGGGLFSLETLKENFPRLEEFDVDSKDALVWFEPPSLSPRIVNQYAFFSVMPGVERSHSEWLERHPEWHWCIPIPSRLKAEIRQRLQVMNMTQRVMYPGLEGVAQWLKAYYGGPTNELQPDSYNLS
jgi:hypothetical protein